jgi:replicative DNA helicase
MRWPKPPRRRLTWPGCSCWPRLATCAGGRARVEVRPGWQEPLNLYVLVAMPPGERKTAVFEAVTAPLSEFEEERARALSPITTEAPIRWRTLDRAVEAMQAEAAKAKTADAREAGIQRAAELAAEADTVVVPTHLSPARGRFDPGSAHLPARRAGRAHLRVERRGRRVRTAGRYSTGRVSSNLDIYLKGHAGSRLRVDRKGRPPSTWPGRR